MAPSQEGLVSHNGTLHRSSKKLVQYHRDSEDSWSCRPSLGWVVLLMFTVGSVLEHTQVVPEGAVRLGLFAGLLVLLWRILTFRRWNDEHRYVGRFLLCFGAMILELTVENCVVWLVSASDLRKYDYVPALQDNVDILFTSLGRRNADLAWFLQFRWAHTLHFLVVLLALAFSVLWDQVPFSGFGLMSRVVLTICCSRILRMVCFMSTVLPNPTPGCYSRRFPPVPPDVWGLIKAGFTTIRGFGGCNDLIFSGHGAFWVLAPLAYQTYYPGWTSRWLWFLLAHSSVKDVLDHQHYSVDMILAVVVTAAVWTWLEKVYPASEPLPQRPPGAPKDKLNVFVIGLIALALLVAGVIVIGGKA